MTAATIENVQSSTPAAIDEPIVETSAAIDVDFSSSDGGMGNVSLAATNALNSLSVVFDSPPVKKLPLITSNCDTDVGSLLMELLAEMKNIKNELIVVKNDVQNLEGVVSNIDEKVETLLENTGNIEKNLKTKIQKRLNNHNLQPISRDKEPVIRDTVQKNREPSFTELVASSINSDESETYLWKSILSQTPVEDSHASDINFTSPTQNVLINNTYENPPIPIERQTSTPCLKKKRAPVNRCSGFIKAELERQYSEIELAHGSVEGGKRTYDGEVIKKTALSPNRLKTILSLARKNFKDDFETITNMNELVNSKCRQIKRRVVVKKMLEEKENNVMNE